MLYMLEAPLLEGPEHRRQRLTSLWHKMTRRKALADHQFFLDEESSDKYTLFDLLCIGIGGTVGSGVFVLTGSVLPVAGPSASLSWHGFPVFAQ